MVFTYKKHVLYLPDVPLYVGVRWQAYGRVTAALSDTLACYHRGILLGGAGVAQWLCNGLPRDGPGFDGGNGVKIELQVLRKGQ